MKLFFCIVGIVFMVVVINARPQCPMMCTLEYMPICGSDGKTYGNRCELRIASCRTRGAVRLGYEGECSPNGPPVGSIECLRRCHRIYRPVCGSNGETYSNECVMEQKACELNENITKTKNGPC